MEFKKGNLVTRSSYNSDIIFKIVKIKEDKAILKSYKYRLMADAPVDDLIRYKDISPKKLKKNLLIESIEHLKRHQRNLIINNTSLKRKEINSCREIPGKVLHLDGDKDYLEICMQNYDTLQIEAKGFFIPEKEQPGSVSRYLEKYKPDILVITGHDGSVNGKNKNNSTRTSRYFLESVKKARDFENDLDRLVIFAGACQSRYYELIEKGANFASSPAGEFIHFLDPVLIAEKIAFASIKEIVSVKEVINYTISKKTVGGVETRGKLRLGYP